MHRCSFECSYWCTWNDKDHDRNYFYRLYALTSSTMVHWATCLLDFQQYFFSSLGSRTKSITVNSIWFFIPYSSEDVWNRQRDAFYDAIQKALKSFSAPLKELTTLPLTFSLPIPLRLFTLPYWSNPPFSIFDIRALWRSVVSARVPECQKLKMVG